MVNGPKRENDSISVYSTSKGVNIKIVLRLWASMQRVPNPEYQQRYLLCNGSWGYGVNLMNILEATEEVRQDFKLERRILENINSAHVLS